MTPNLCRKCGADISSLNPHAHHCHKCGPAHRRTRNRDYMRQRRGATPCARPGCQHTARPTSPTFPYCGEFCQNQTPPTP